MKGTHMELKKIIYRREGNLLKSKRKKVFICELTEEEYIDRMNTHKKKDQTEILLESNEVVENGK